MKQTQAFVLKKIDYGENDEILGLLTKDFGKITAFAKSRKKSVKRFCSSMDLFARINVVLDEPRTSGMHRLIEAKTIDPYFEIRLKLNAFFDLSYLFDCLWHMLPEHHQDPEVFDWLCQVMDQIKTQPFDSRTSILRELSLLELLGYWPSDQTCMNCHQSNLPLFYLYFDHKVLCLQCAKSTKYAIDLVLINQLNQGYIVSDHVCMQVKNHLDRVMAMVIGKTLKSKECLKGASA